MNSATFFACWTAAMESLMVVRQDSGSQRPILTQYRGTQQSEFFCQLMLFGEVALLSGL